MAKVEGVHTPTMTIAGWLPVLLAAGIFVALLQAAPAVSTGEPLLAVWPWVPSLGVSLSFWIDRLSLAFGLLISGIGALVFLYAGPLILPIAAMATLTVLIDLFPEPFVALAERSAAQLLNPSDYIETVLGGDR